jgi:hypothetical protein
MSKSFFFPKKIMSHVAYVLALASSYDKYQLYLFPYTLFSSKSFK